MRQLTLTCADDFNFYSYPYYLNEFNEYGEQQWEQASESNKIKMHLSSNEVKKLISKEMGVPASRIRILEVTR